MRVRGARVRLTVVGLALLGLGLAGCGDGAGPDAVGVPSRTPSPTDASSPADPSSGTPSGTTGPADPAHAVAAPGPFRPPLQTPDILVFRQRPLSAAMVRQIRHLDGVTRVERFSLAQVSVQDHAINVAAVDPATYRDFNPERIARFQQEWDRIAGGEMALSPSFRRQVEQDGYVRMGARADAPRIHVGAYAPQIPQIDAVVNRAWAHDLGMRPGNALLVSTGIRTPSSIRKPTAADRGPGGVGDPDGRRGPLRPRHERRADRVPGRGRPPTRSARSATPSSAAAGSRRSRRGWPATSPPGRCPIIGAMTCNTAMFPQLKAALDQIVAQGLAGAIHPSQYGGCFVPRFIAGTTTLSNHAFGLAFDLNVPENQRGTVGRIDRRVVAIFQQWGFTWGGTWRYTDPMHFELNRIVRAG